MRFNSLIQLINNYHPLIIEFYLRVVIISEASAIENRDIDRDREGALCAAERPIYPISSRLSICLFVGPPGLICSIGPPCPLPPGPATGNRDLVQALPSSQTCYREPGYRDGAISVPVARWQIPDPDMVPEGVAASKFQIFNGFS